MSTIVLTKKHNLLPKSRYPVNKSTWLIVLHHTAGPTLAGAEATLKQRGLGYHYMIEQNGHCVEYGTPNDRMNHAAGFNTNTVSISFIGGGGYGAVTEAQIEACIGLINTQIKPQGPLITTITGHKHCSPKRKIDPQFPGESPSGTNLAIDKTFMDRIANATGLTFQSKF